MIGRPSYMVRVLARGGILTPSYMLNILSAVKATGHKHVHFGSRQDLLFEVNHSQMPLVKKTFESMKLNYIIHGRKGQLAQNIVSSYVASDMTTSTTWLSSGNYLYVLENFEHQPTLRVNIADPKQSLVPLFYGHLNFIASSVKDYWYLYIRRTENSKPERWPVLVLSDDIGNLSEALEQNWRRTENLPDLFELIQKQLKYNWRNVETELQLDAMPAQDYEGFGKMHNSQNYWAGFYWRNNNYDVAFLEELCHLCLRTGVSKICLTPWKSLLVKELKEKDLIQWQRLLGRFGINMRHSSFELNWHLPLKNKQAFRLKRYVVKKFDKVDVCVHGLTFGIKTKGEPSFCAIQIERIPGIRLFKTLDLFVTYRILYARQFNANTCEYEEYIPQVPRYHLPEQLQNLTLKFYAQLSETNEKHSRKTKVVKEDKTLVYQCSHCFTVYDEKLGDSFSGIKPNTSFEQLPESYCCAICEASKIDFKPVYITKLIKEANA